MQKILLLTRYSYMGASSRLRSLQYLPWLRQENLVCTSSPFIIDRSLERLYQRGSYGFAAIIMAYWERIRNLLQQCQYDLIWIEKEALPWLPAWLESFLLGGTPYVLDYDDAIFHNYDQHSSLLVRYFLGQRIDKLMMGARLVTSGNSYLKQRAENAGAQKVEIIPTVIDLERYEQKTDIRNDGIPRIVWIGSPNTMKYLRGLHEPLVRLSQRFVFKLRVIASSSIELLGVDVEFVKWTEETEVVSLQECDIGIMPLLDTPWERGKCGYKLIQYMACSLPVVASPIGANMEIVDNNENGYFAATETEWVDTLGQLLSDVSLRQKMGKVGRRKVESEYCIQQVAPKLIKLLHEAAKVGH